ncbi:hypothetical protein MTO96_011768 [Rhipicephalus appendiculatus]
MATFTSPSQRPPRVKHRRHASLSLVARTPSTLDEEFSARIELERRSRISLDDWLRDLTAIDFAQPAPSSGAQDPAANAPATPALAEPVNPAALVTTQDCSRAVLRDSSLAERIGVPLPASDDEESMDMSSSRKRAREDSCDEDAQGPRKQLPTDYPADLPDDRGDDGPHTSIAATSSELESSADTSDTSVAPSPSAGNAPVAPAPAASQLQETDGMEASTEAEEHDAAQEHVSSAPPNPAAAFLRDPPCIANVVTRKKLKKKKNKKRRQAGKQNRPSATPGASTCNNTTPCTALAVATTRIEEREIPCRVSCTAIDVSLATRGASYDWATEPDSWGSDHLPITITPAGGKTPRTRLCTIVDWRAFRQQLRMASEERDFLGLVAQAAEAATIRTREPVCRPVPDIHQLQLRAARRRVERHFLKSSCPEKRRLFNRVNAVCRRHANRRTRQSWQGICHSLNEAKGGSRAWRLLRCLILGPAVQQPVLAVAIYLGISEEALAERLADRFATIPVTPPDAVIHPRLPKPPLGHHPAWTAARRFHNLAPTKSIVFQLPHAQEVVVHNDDDARLARGRRGKFSFYHRISAFAEYRVAAPP